MAPKYNIIHLPKFGIKQTLQKKSVGFLPWEIKKKL